MPQFTSPRPSFDNPPVVEVSLGLQFEPLPALQVVHYGLFWDKIRSEFPITEVKLALDSMIETFESPKAIQMKVQFVEGFPEIRVWFINAAQTELVQVQRDRFIFNWRQHDGSPYPRYGHVKKRFIELYDKFSGFLTSENLGQVAPNHCEVMYINHILTGETFVDLGKLEALVEPWSGKTSDGFLSPPEEAAFTISYILPDAEGAPIGRLRVVAEPRIRVKDQQKIFQASFIARGIPPKSNLEGVLEFFDLGREYVVRGFTSLTTPAMHRQWRRNDV